MAQPTDRQRTDRQDRQHRALAVPARRQIFELIVGAPAPLGVAELAAKCRIHENTVRRHLASLLDAGLVIQETEARSRPGRPGYRYRAVEPDPYRQLAAWLAEAVRSRSGAREAGRRIGRREAARLGRHGLVASMFDVLAHHGFAPAWEADSGTVRVLALYRCPFDAVAANDPTTICSLHLGLAEGVAEAAGRPAVVELEPGSSRPGSPCRLRLQ